MSHNPNINGVSTTERFAVIGNLVAHSLSPKIHNLFAKQVNKSLVYEIIQCAHNQFQQQVENFFATGGKGLNVTAPFKQDAYNLAVSTSVRSKQARAANTLWIKDQKLIADNTDGIGFIRDLIRAIDPAGKNILVLGAGGAARGILGPLLSMAPRSLAVLGRSLAQVFAVRQIFPGIADVLEVGDYDIVINATSLGAYTNIWDWEFMRIKPTTYCYDLSYSIEATTPFVRWAKSHGAAAIDGIGMLIEQAAASFLIWHGILPNTQPVLRLFAR